MSTISSNTCFHPHEFPDFFSLRSVLRSAVALKLFLLLPTAAFSDPNQKPGPRIAGTDGEKPFHPAP